MNSVSTDLGASLRVMGPYVEGWCDSISRTAVDLVEELAAETEARMCDPDADPAELSVMARIVRRMPELGNSHGVDCMTERDPEQVAFDTETLLRRNNDEEN